MEYSHGIVVERTSNIEFESYNNTITANRYDTDRNKFGAKLGERRELATYNEHLDAMRYPYRYIYP